MAALTAWDIPTTRILRVDRATLMGRVHVLTLAVRMWHTFELEAMALSETTGVDIVFFATVEVAEMELKEAVVVCVEFD